MGRHNRARAAAMAAGALLVAACGSSTTSSSSGGIPSGPIVIGAAIAKTGGFAAFDASIVAAVQLAVNDVNAKGGVLGHQLKLVESDTKSDPNQAATAATTVLSQGAKLLITASDYDQAVGAALVGQSQGVLVFSPAAGSPKYGVQGIGNLAFTMGEAAPAEGAIDADWAFNDQKWKSAYELEDTTLAFTISNCSGFDSRWVSDGGKVLGKNTFANTDTSIQAQITSLQALSPKPDFIYLCSYPPGGVTAIKQIRAAGINIPIVTNSSFDGSYWLSSVPGLSNYYQNAYGSYFGNDPRPEVNTVAPRLKAISAASDSSLALCGYAVVEAFVEAVEKTGSVDGQTLRKALETTAFPTVLGPTLYTATNHIANANREMVIIAVQNGTRQYVTLFKVDPPPPLNYATD